MTAPTPSAALFTASASGTSHDIDLTGLPESGALLLMRYLNEGYVGSTAPTGWTNVYTGGGGYTENADTYTQIWARKSDGTEGTSVNVTSNSAVPVLAYVLKFDPGDWADSGTLTDDVKVAFANTGYGGGTSDPPNLTPGGTEDYLWITDAWYGNGGSITAQPSGFDEEETGTGASFKLSVASLAGSAESSKDPGVWSLSGTGALGNCTISIAPGTATASAALTGTVTGSIDESDVVTGGKTIILTLTGDTFVAAGTGPIGSTADTQAIIDGISAASSPAGGWNDEWRDKEVTSAVVRTSDTVATITMSSQATLSGSYDISAQETITVTIPGAALTGASPIVASPTFTVDIVSAGALLSVLQSHNHFNGGQAL